MQIYDLLHKDHEEVKALLSELVSLDVEDTYHTVLIDQIAAALIPHSRAEEAVFYNPIRGVSPDDAKDIRHGFKEHIEAEALLRILQAKDTINMNWKETALKLQKALDHHVAEEESTIFNEAKNIFTAEEAESIGEAFTELKERISGQNNLVNAFELIKNLMPKRLQGPEARS